VSWPDHPPAFDHSHPWLDPLAPQDALAPRPDAEIAIAGGFAPRPDEFPFTPAGRAEFYEAVRDASRRQLMMRDQHLACTDPPQGSMTHGLAGEDGAGLALLLLL
jgi:hypothetical protein